MTDVMPEQQAVDLDEFMGDEPAGVRLIRCWRGRSPFQ
ncbi:MAG: hypothetical protein QOJ50_2116 [Cryptosporangiaceae bacterium]|jgi:hypothetical protein|nr:hypothetical protein [Cryptosporangiaceae bacterium]